MTIDKSNTMLKTIQKYANEIGTSQQNVRQSKKLHIVECPIYAMYGGEYIHVGSQKFIVTDNQEVVK